MPRKKHTSADVPLPKLNPVAVTEVEQWLMVENQAKRPPTTAAPLLALIVELDRLKSPFPSVPRVARHIGAIGRYGIDCAIARALAQGIISETHEIADGGTNTRDGVTRIRRYIPNDTLRQMVTDASAKRMARRA